MKNIISSVIISVIVVALSVLGFVLGAPVLTDLQKETLLILVIVCGAANYGIFNWTMAGPLFLIFLFLGSSAFGEGISKSKCPEYSLYLAHVSKYIPLRKYRPERYQK